MQHKREIILNVVLLLFRRLGVELGKSVVFQESNSGKRNDWNAKSCLEKICESERTDVLCLYAETRVDVKESVRGQTIFIIQTIPRWVESLETSGHCSCNWIIHILFVVVVPMISHLVTLLQAEMSTRQSWSCWLWPTPSRPLVQRTLLGLFRTSLTANSARWGKGAPLYVSC